MKPDYNPQPDEVPGVRWLAVARKSLRRIVPGSRALDRAGEILARRRAVPRAQALRDRVEAARALTRGPARAVASAPAGMAEPPAEPGRQPEGAEGRGLDPILRRRIEALLRMELPLIRIHTGEGADRFARRHDADAVTVGRDTYFRQGAFDPATPRGLGLLAHEATHAAWDAGARFAGRPGAAVAADVEERTALANERRVLRGDAAPAPPGGASQPVMPPAAGARAAVKTAAASRDLTEPEAPAGPAELSAGQVRALKDDIYRTLLDKLRSDFERGA